MQSDRVAQTPLGAGQVRIVMADDHGLFRDGLKLLLGLEPGWQVVAEVSDLGHLKACVQQHEPDLLLMDYHMPGGDASALMGYFRQRYPDLKLVALTGARSGPILRQLVAVGADAVLLKDGSGAELVRALRAVVILGQKVLAPGVAELVADADPGLTRRELQLVKLLYDGLGNKEIAELLALSPKTVDKHRENIMRKMEVNSLAQLVKKVHALGLLAGDGAAAG